MFQYVGQTLGKHPVAPSVSPIKLEGLIGCATATAMVQVFGGSHRLLGGSRAPGVGFRLMGFFGGLVMSSIKRDRGVKDFGATIAGHGGIMDRLDSLSFSAPVFFHLVRFFFTA